MNPTQQFVVFTPERNCRFYLKHQTLQQVRIQRRVLGNLCKPFTSLIQQILIRQSHVEKNKQTKIRHFGRTKFIGSAA